MGHAIAARVRLLVFACQILISDQAAMSGTAAATSGGAVAGS